MIAVYVYKDLSLYVIYVILHSVCKLFGWMFTAVFGVLLFVIYIIILIAIYVLPLAIRSPCIVEKSELPTKPLLLAHKGASAVRIYSVYCCLSLLKENIL